MCCFSFYNNSPLRRHAGCVVVKREREKRARERERERKQIQKTKIKVFTFFSSRLPISECVKPNFTFFFNPLKNMSRLLRSMLLVVTLLALVGSAAVSAAAEPGEVAAPPTESKVEVESPTRKVDASSPAPAPAPSSSSQSKVKKDLDKVDASVKRAYNKTKDGVEDAYKKARKRN